MESLALTLNPFPNGTKLIDPETQEQWVIAYCEAISLRDPFCPYAYGCVDAGQDERVVFHDRIWNAGSLAEIWPR